MAGRSHAILTRGTATSGGNNGLTPASRFGREAGKTVVADARHPLAHDPSAHLETPRDAHDGVPFSPSQADLGTLGQSSRKGGGTLPAVQFGAFSR